MCNRRLIRVNRVFPSPRYMAALPLTTVTISFHRLAISFDVMYLEKNQGDSE